ncbi:MAG TPA: XRE family transcriptional regulator [Chthoniobacterales bacterium]|nr:XRE family transcriptional regulator [Chthoniobacterales bacterium]
MILQPLEQIDLKVLGERLRSARRTRGLTQEQVAEKLQYSRTTVVAIEKGERRVTEAELIAFAHEYGRAVSEFVRRPEKTPPLIPQFRAGPLSSRSVIPVDTQPFVQAAEELDSLAADYVELEQLCEMPLPMEYPAIYRVEGSFNRPEELGEEVAAAERARLGLGNGAITDVRALLQDAVGLRIFYYAMPTPIAGVFAYNDAAGGCIGINAQHPVPRGNFSLAHEYAHFLTTRYQADVALETGGWGRLPTEKFADSFASNLLMPRAGVNRRFSEIADTRQGQDNIRIADLVQLAHLFGVSVQAMCLRFEQLRRVPVGTWDHLKERGFRPDFARAALGLPPAADNRDLLPRRYLLLARRAYEEGLISEGQLAKKLRQDRLSARLTIEKLDGLIDAHTENGYQPLVVDFAERLVTA